MKRFVSFITWLLWCIMLLSACTPGKTNDTTEITDPGDHAGEAAEQKEPVTLDVYYWAEHVHSSYILNTFRSENITINATAFSSLEEMDTRIAAEVNANKGPDVILFPYTTALDTTKMAMNGAFLDLTDMLAADETFDTNNYYCVLDAGNIGGKQLLMPLSFRFPYIYTTQERMAAMGMELPENYTISQLMSAYLPASAGLSEDFSSITTLFPFPEGMLIYDPLRLTNIEIVDLQEQTLTISKDVLREYADFAKVLKADRLKTVDIAVDLGADFDGGLTHVHSFYDYYQFPAQMRAYEVYFSKGLNETFQILHLPNYDDPASLTADIPLYTAILQSTDHAAAAFQFVRHAMDSLIGDLSADLPVSRSSVAAHLDKLCSSVGSTLKLRSGRVPVPPMSVEFRQQCEQLFDSITSGSICNNVLHDIFTETMGAYINGEAEFEECYTKFQNQVSLYLYE